MSSLSISLLLYYFLVPFPYCCCYGSLYLCILKVGSFHGVVVLSRLFGCLQVVCLYLGYLCFVSVSLLDILDSFFFRLSACTLVTLATWGRKCQNWPASGFSPSSCNCPCRCVSTSSATKTKPTSASSANAIIDVHFVT